MTSRCLAWKQGWITYPPASNGLWCSLNGKFTWNNLKFWTFPCHVWLPEGSWLLKPSGLRPLRGWLFLPCLQTLGPRWASSGCGWELGPPQRRQPMPLLTIVLPPAWNALLPMTRSCRSCTFYLLSSRTGSEHSMWKKFTDSLTLAADCVGCYRTSSFFAWLLLVFVARPIQRSTAAWLQGKEKEKLIPNLSAHEVQSHCHGHSYCYKGKYRRVGFSLLLNGNL